MQLFTHKNKNLLLKWDSLNLYFQLPAPPDWTEFEQHWFTSIHQSKIILKKILQEWHMLFTAHHHVHIFSRHICVWYLSTKPTAWSLWNSDFFCDLWPELVLSLLENRQLRNNGGSLRNVRLQKWNLKHSIFPQGIVPNIQWKVAEIAHHICAKMQNSSFDEYKSCGEVKSSWGQRTF